MQLGGWVKATIDILNEFSVSGQPLAPLLKGWAAKNRYAGSTDRHNILNLVYDALRLRGFAQSLLQSERWEAVVLYVLLLQYPGDSRVALEQELCENKYSAAIMVYLPDHIPAYNATHIEASIPNWLRPYFRRSFTDDYIDQTASFLERPAIDLRVNLLKSQPDITLALLREDGIDVQPVFTFIPQALRLPAAQRLGKKVTLTNRRAFTLGHFEVQDLGSQIIAKLVGAKADMRILDYCAGAGGKTLAMAADMANRGLIYVHDINMQRLAPLKVRMQRAGVKNIKFAMQKSVLDSLLNNMDKVVLDVPCSGSGTWRRAPDRKWLFTYKELEYYCNKQAEILFESAKYVKPGGYLYYLTCSIFCEENDNQIEQFLRQNSHFEVAPINAGHIPCYNTVYGILLTPYKTSSDGFYFSALRRSR